jgi:hypothetical protein
MVLSAQKAKVSDKVVDGSQISNDYNRISLTYLMLDNSTGKYFSMMKESFKDVVVSEKYDDNSIDQHFVTSSGSSASAYFIKEALVSKHFVNSVIAKWFSRKEDGSFGVELMHQRGLYNATDGEVLTANASKRGMARIKDAGEQLINSSFIIVFEINDLITMDELYDREQKSSKTSIKRYKNGFAANIIGHVYQIDFNDTISNFFFEKLWAEPGDADLAFKKESFDNFRFPIKYLTTTKVTLESSQWNPGYSTSPPFQLSPDIIMFGLIQGGIGLCLEDLEENFGQFKVTTSIYKTWPIRAKIGTKEGLERDQRYFVFQMTQDNNGKIVGKRKGVIRANRVIDNSYESTGKTQPSSFYQVAGGTLKKGMTLQQKSDRGIAFSFGISQGSVGGIDIRFEGDLTRMSSKLPPMVKIFLEGGFQPSTYDVTDDYGGTTTYTNFWRYGFGFGKEFCFLRNFKLQPFAGIGLEEVSDEDDSKAVLKSPYVHPGFIFGINITHNVQLTWQYSYYMMDFIILDKDNQEVIVNGLKEWNKAWDRGGVTNTFGIRFEM